MGAGAEADETRRVPLAVADVLDVGVRAAPVERGVLRARHELLGQLLLVRGGEARARRSLGVLAGPRAPGGPPRVRESRGEEADRHRDQGRTASRRSRARFMGSA